jgi:hypothetical protein
LVWAIARKNDPLNLAHDVFDLPFDGLVGWQVTCQPEEYILAKMCKSFRSCTVTVPRFRPYFAISKIFQAWLAICKSNSKTQPQSSRCFGPINVVAGLCYFLRPRRRSAGFGVSWVMKVYRAFSHTRFNSLLIPVPQSHAILSSRHRLAATVASSE